MLGCFRSFIPMSMHQPGVVIHEQVEGVTVTLCFLVLAKDPPGNLQPPYNVDVMMVPAKIEHGLPFYPLLAALYLLIISYFKDLKA